MLGLCVKRTGVAEVVICSPSPVSVALYVCVHAVVGSGSRILSLPCSYGCSSFRFGNREESQEYRDTCI